MWYELERNSLERHFLSYKLNVSLPKHKNHNFKKFIWHFSDPLSCFVLFKCPLMFRRLLSVVHYRQMYNFPLTTESKKWAKYLPPRNVEAKGKQTAKWQSRQINVIRRVKKATKKYITNINLMKLEKEINLIKLFGLPIWKRLHQKNYDKTKMLIAGYNI